MPGAFIDFLIEVYGTFPLSNWILTCPKAVGHLEQYQIEIVIMWHNVQLIFSILSTDT